MNRISTAALPAETILAQIGAKPMRLPKLKDRNTDNQNYQTIANFQNDLETFFLKHEAAEQLIYNDVRLSDDGRQEKFVPLRLKASDDLNGGIFNRVKNLINIHLGKCERLFEIPAAVFAGDPIVIEARCREVRDFVRALPMTERIDLLFRSDDSFLIHAFDSAPACISLVPEDVLEQARLARVIRKRSADLVPLQDEREMLLLIKSVMENIPTVLKWVTINPAFPVMSDTVIPEGADDTDPIISDGADAVLLDLHLQSAGQSVAAE